MMDELEREQKNAQPPSSMAFARQFQRMTVFGELLRDVDRNKTNVLYVRLAAHHDRFQPRVPARSRAAIPQSAAVRPHVMRKLKALTEPEVRKRSAFC